MIEEQNVQPLFVEERKHKIIELLEENAKILVPELCETFGVSSVTIRNDLRELELEGKLTRTHGGAIRISKASFEPIPGEKVIKNSEEKQRIAAFAADLVQNGDTIALDAGSTTYELAKQLIGKEDLTVVTNDIKIAALLEAKLKNSTIVLIGGLLRDGFHCTVGPLALYNLEQVNVDKVFLAANGFSIEKGFSTPSFNQAEVKKMLVKIANKVIFLVDSEKYGKDSFVKVSDFSEIDMLITDNKLNASAVSRLQDNIYGYELFVV